MKWIVSNHKNFLSGDLIDNYVNQLDCLDLSNTNLVVCPSYKNLSYFKEHSFFLGSQCFVNVGDLKDNGVKYTIVGHSYRRKKYNETDDVVNEKIRELLEHNIVPILCIGEEIEQDDVKTVLKNQLEKCLVDISGNVIIAYEPVWAINSGNVPDYGRLVEIFRYISDIVYSLLGYSAILLYGGSVNDKTIIELEKIKEIDGYLIGSASVDIEKLKRIIDVVEGKENGN